MSTHGDKPLHRSDRLLDAALALHRDERLPTALAFACIFILMAAYYVLRPVRDAMASDWSNAEVSALWTLNFVLCTGVVAVYGYVVSHVRLRFVVPGVYAFFATSFLLFHWLLDDTGDRSLADKAFYVWVSVFSLFHVSVFWSFMAEVFDHERAERLFPLIATGASAGALAGPSVPALLGGALGPGGLTMLAAAMLMLPLPMLLALLRRPSRQPASAVGMTAENAAERRVGGHALDGFALFASNPKLLGIAVFLLLFTMVNSFAYFEQKNLLEAYDRATRVRLLGAVDWLTNLLTFLLALFATSRLLRRLGIAVTLALVPLLAAAGLLALTVTPTAMVVLGLQVARRAGEYAVTRPARETLFTQIDREARFKAKPVIDTVVYRGGDTLTGWLFAGLTQGLGLGLATVALIGAFIAGVWAAVGWLLGRAFAHTGAASPITAHPRGRTEAS